MKKIRKKIKSNKRKSNKRSDRGIGNCKPIFYDKHDKHNNHDKQICNNCNKSFFIKDCNMPTLGIIRPGGLELHCL